MALRDTDRRLAAIVFTDITGYTAMMQRDEKLAMAAVRRHHEALETCVPMHGGQIHQYYGDGSLSIFNSVTDAVACALEFQKHLLQAPEVPVRVGIHIGEIYFEDGKIFGDGVNVASRIESIGQPGTVLFSRHVFEKVRNHTEFKICPVGKFEFKNVDDPVEVYALANPEIRTPDVRHIEGKLKEQRKSSRRPLLISGIGVGLAMLVIAALYLYPRDGITSPDAEGYFASLAVLPFDNVNKNPEEDYLCVGIGEDILTQLAQIQGLKVISRSSSVKYKDIKDKSNKEIAKELGVSNLLEGSVQKHESTLHVSVHLISASDERVIWADEFNRSTEDILNVQRDIAKMVSDKLQIKLTPKLRSRLENKSNVKWEAYADYLKGQEVLLRSSGLEQDIDTAMGYFDRAIAIDSGFSKAWVGIANASLESVFWHRSPDSISLPRATHAANIALQLDPDLGEAYAALGAVDEYANKFASAEQYLDRAIELSPNYPFGYERLAWIKLFRGKADEGLALLEKAVQLDPLSTRYKGAIGTAYYMLRRYDEGITKTKEYLTVHPNDNFILWALAYLYAGKGDYKTAIAYLDQRTIGRKTNWVYAYCYSKLNQKTAAREILDTLLVRDKQGYVPDFMMAVTYTANGEYQNAMNRLELASGAGGESFFAWGIKTDPMFDPSQN